MSLGSDRTCKSYWNITFSSCNRISCTNNHFFIGLHKTFCHSTVSLMYCQNHNPALFAAFYDFVILNRFSNLQNVFQICKMITDQLARSAQALKQRAISPQKRHLEYHAKWHAACKAFRATYSMTAFSILIKLLLSKDIWKTRYLEAMKVEYVFCLSHAPGILG